MKRELAKPFIMVDASPSGTVQNIAMFDNYEDANQTTKAVFGESAFADEYKWLVAPGDVFHDGQFYIIGDNGQEELAEYIPDDSQKIDELVTQSSMLRNMASMQAMAFTDAQALTVKNLYPLWSSLSDGTTLTKQEDVVNGTEITKVLGDDGKIYKVITTHNKQSDWAPGQTTASLFSVIDEEHAGTIDDPIPFSVNMVVYNGKYYNYNGVTYKCIRDSGIALQYTPDQLLDNYFELA